MPCRAKSSIAAPPSRVKSRRRSAAVDAALAAAELNLEFTRVTAPITGRVGRAIVTEGNLVSTGPGEATLLTTLVSIDPIHAHFDADEGIFLKYLDMAKQGRRENARATRRPIRLALAGEEGYPREGHLDFLDNRLDPEHRHNPRPRDLPQSQRRSHSRALSSACCCRAATRIRALLIQDRAVGTDLDKRFVFVVEAATKALSTGRSRSDRSSTVFAWSAAASKPASGSWSAACSACALA